MKPRLFFLPLVLASVFVIARASAAPADDPPAPTPDPAPVNVKVQGKTAAQWHRVAGRYLQSVRALNHRPTPWGGNWLEGAFMCIHSHEGSWTDPNPPFYGGVQMDYSFQRSYAPWALREWGTADHWPISVQIATAIRAYVAGRGFHPWPNTARYCGLIR